MNVGTYLIRKSDGVGAVVVGRDGGAYDWITLRMESGRTAQPSASGVARKYDAVSDRAGVIARAIESHRGFLPGTVALAIAASVQDDIDSLIGDPELVGMIRTALAEDG